MDVSGGAGAFEHRAVDADGEVVVCGLHRLFEVASEPMCVASFDGQLLQVNPAWTQLLGWELEQLLGRAYLDFVHPDDLAPTREAAAALTRGEGVVAFDNRYRHIHGGYRWLRWSSVPVVAEERVYAVVRDVTDERRQHRHQAEVERVSGVGTWSLELDTDRVLWSAGVHAIHGTDPQTDEPNLAEALSFFPPAAQDRLVPAMERLRQTGEPFDLELDFVDRQGRNRWVRATGVAEVWEDRVVGVHGTFQDITPHRTRTEELERLNRRLDDAQRLARLGAWEHDLASGSMRLSSVVSGVLGWFDEAREVPFAEVRARVHPGDLARFDASQEQLRTDGQLDLMLRVVTVDGRERSVRVLARAVHGPHGELVAVEGTLQDVTDLTALTRALTESEQRLQRVLVATQDGWWDTDLDSGRVIHSRRWLALHGYEPGELPEVYDTWRSLMHPADLVAIDAVIDEVVAARQPSFSVTGRVQHRAGHLVPVVIRGVIDYARDGRPIRISGATTDVSEQHRADALQQAFVSNVSHELRTPLTAIGGALELLEAGVGGELSSSAAQLVDVARRNNLRLRRLIDDLLDMERLASGQVEFVAQVQPLLPLLERSLEELGPYGLERGVTFALTRRAEALVEVDADRLAQVLANLLSNAAKHAPEGSPVELQLQRTAGTARVEVIDGGPGVPPEFGAQVFERFAQADPRGDTARGGTGLGLAIARAIIEQHGGRIGYESEPGRTCFWFELPLPT